MQELSLVAVSFTGSSPKVPVNESSATSLDCTKNPLNVVPATVGLTPTAKYKNYK